MSTDRLAMRRTLFALASGQAGFFTAAQAQGIGYSYPAQAHHIRAGNWQRFHRGILRLTDWVPELHDDLAMWTLWSRGRAVISHHTALAVHTLGEFESPTTHLTVPPGFTMRNPALTLHHADLTSDDIQDHTGFRVTTPTRSLIDIAATAPDEHQLARAITEARQRGLISLPALRGRAETIDPRAALYLERAIHVSTRP